MPAPLIRHKYIMTQTIDFIRPKGTESGVLLNTNNEALSNYKKAKKRMATIPLLEERVEKLEQLLTKLLEEKE